MNPGICVVGSANADLIMRLPQLPAVGETVSDGEFHSTYGGKGANQAIAAARAGGSVRFLCAVGDDEHGRRICSNLEADGIRSRDVHVVAGSPTGIAMVLFDGEGRNYLAVAAGANARLEPEHVGGIAGWLDQSAALLLQCEVPRETNLAAIRAARARGVRVFLNFAPARACERELAAECDVLVVNESEAAVFVGRPPCGQDEAAGAARELLKLGCGAAVITLGADGAVAVSAEGEFRQAAFPIAAVDSTAAGDTLCGALAVELSRGASWPEALRFASAAAALCVSRLGAQPSIPSSDEIHAFLT